MMTVIFVVVITPVVRTALACQMVIAWQIIAEPVIMIAVMTVYRIVPVSGVARQKYQIFMLMQMAMDLALVLKYLFVMHIYHLAWWAITMMKMMTVFLMYMTVLVYVMEQAGRVIVDVYQKATLVMTVMTVPACQMVITWKINVAPVMIIVPMTVNRIVPVSGVVIWLMMSVAFVVAITPVVRTVPAYQMVIAG